jgi:site-specific recombinase XerC
MCCNCSRPIANRVLRRELHDRSKVLPKDFKDWISRQQSVERARPTTINLRVAAVRKFFARLHESGQLMKNPAAKVRFLDTDKAEFKGLDEKHYKQLSL